MPRRSVEARLQSLQDKRDAVAAEIKKIQAEKARALRQRQRQREALVGRVIYQLIGEGAVITADTWSEGFLEQLMDNQLTRQRDRQLFGLPSLAEAGSVVDKARSDRAAADQQRDSSLVSSAIDSTPLTPSKTTPVTRSEAAAAPGRKLNEGGSQDDLMSEFNL